MRDLEAKNFESIWCTITWSRSFKLFLNLTGLSIIVNSFLLSSLSSCGSRRIHLSYNKRQRKSKSGGWFSFPFVFRRKKIFPKSPSLGTLPAFPLRDLWQSSHCQLRLWRDKKNVHWDFPSWEVDISSKGLGLYPKMMEYSVKGFSSKARKWGWPLWRRDIVWAEATLVGIKICICFTPKLAPICLTDLLSVLTVCSRMLKLSQILFCFAFTFSLCFVLDKVSLNSPSCPRWHYGEQTGPKCEWTSS